MVERALSTSPSLDVSVAAAVVVDWGGNNVDLVFCDLPKEAVLGLVMAAVLPTVVEGRVRRDDAMCVTKGAGWALQANVVDLYAFLSALIGDILNLMKV